MIMGSAIWLLIRQSDLATWLILGLLLVLSVISWAIALAKLMALRRKIDEAAVVTTRIAQLNSREQLQELARTLHATTAGYMVARALQSLQMIQRRSNGTLSYDDLMLVRDELGSALTDMMAEEEGYSSFVKTVAEAGPLLGLLGTIWGLIHSFLRMSHEQSADIVTVAPGIAEALITTLAGLLVAIPALFFFHLIMRKLQLFEQHVVTLADQCERLIRMLTGGN
jgi:biopolymer transport protein TolQ